MDEVSLIIDLLDTQWTSSATALVDDGTISVSHSGKPNFIDVRSLEKNKGVRYDLSSKDVIIVFEDSNEIIYPTLFYDTRREIYNFTLHIRTVQDERAGTDADFGKDRLRALYLITRRVVESKRRGYESSDNSCFNQLFFGARSESNDRAKRLFGYKINLTANRRSLLP